MSATYSYNWIIAFNGGRDDDDFVRMDELIPDGQELQKSFESDDINNFKTPRRIKEKENI
jgi:hypothetical protein